MKVQKKQLKLFGFLCSLILTFTLVEIKAQISGCTDSQANNYNPNATINDGSCTYNSASVSVIKSWALPDSLTETSGLIIWNNRIWTHNDDTDVNLYALDTANIAHYNRFPLISCINNDWEEISQDNDYIYIGDFGNNVNGNRTNLQILRVGKASLLQNNPIIDTIRFSYSLQVDFSPTGSNNTDFDCEAFVVSSDSIYLFTKEWVSKKSSIYALPKVPGTYTAEFVSQYNVQGLITGATYLENKKLVVLTGYSSLVQPFLILLYDFHHHNFFSGNKRKISLNLNFTQVEGIATEDGINYFISNEKFTQSIITTQAKISKLNLSAYLSHYLNSLPVKSQDVANYDDRILLYPNPTSERLYLHILNNNYSDGLEIAIYNAIGQVVEVRNINTNSAYFDVSQFPKGCYFLVVFQKKQMLLKSKFFVN